MKELELFGGEVLEEFEKVIPMMAVVMAAIGMMLMIQQLFAPKFVQGFPKSIVVGTTPTLVLPANLGRRYASFVNDSPEVMYLSLGREAALGEGIRLNPEGGWYEMTWTNLYLGDVYAISTGKGNLSIMEGI